jgi:hypothetical protein
MAAMREFISRFGLFVLALAVLTALGCASLGIR